MEILFATKNLGKMKEVREIMEDGDYRVCSMAEAGFDIDVEEDADTFEGNALKKALSVMKMTGKTVLADDSGLEIDWMDKKPGVYSSRYLGEHTPYTEKNAIILDQMKEVPEPARTARYVCVIAAAFPDGSTLTAEGTVEGRIGFESRGENGFGYDPIFYVPEYGKMMAEITPDMKNAISHRGKALRLMKEQLEKRLQAEQGI